MRYFFRAAALAAMVTACGSKPFEDVVVESVDLGDGIHMLTAVGGNVGVLTGPDGVVLVDDQYAEITDRIAAKIDEIAGGGGEDGVVRFVINTHHHLDHVGGNGEWRARGAAVVAHDTARALMIDPVDGSPPRPPAHWPTITFPTEAEFYLNGQSVQVLHVPGGHTGGDVVVRFQEADVVHMGDLLFNGMFPFIDLPAGGSLDGFITALDAALALIGEDTQVIPGHGPLANRRDVVVAAALLRDVRSRISVMVAEGMSAEEIVEADPLTDLDDLYGQSFIDTELFTRIAAISLGAASR